MLIRPKLACSALIALLCTTSMASAPLPTPSNVLISSSRPRLELFEQQTDSNKALLYHLNRVSRLSHTLLFHQRHRHGLVMKRFFENAFDHLDDLKLGLSEKGYREFLIYGLKFLDLAGVYEEGPNLKRTLAFVTEDQLERLFDRFAPKDLTPTSRLEITKLMLDPVYELRQRPQEDIKLEETGGNIYQKGITDAELAQAMTNPSFRPGLNTRVVRGPDGELAVEVQTTQTPGVVGDTLRQIVEELRRAAEVSRTPEQQRQLLKMAEYYETGSIDSFREASIAWVQDRDHSVWDFTTGWVETYEDHLGMTGSMENVIVLVDPKENGKSRVMADNAQYFEDKMPYGPYKKRFPIGYAPPALVAPYFLELSSMHSGGFNLPNYDDIRNTYGFKNVIRIPLGKSAADLGIQREALTEFMPADKVEAALANKDKIWLVHVLFHEILGHGSGTYDVTKYGPSEDPIAGIGKEIGSSMASALEEERADLTGLVLGDDPKLVEIGIFKDQAEADALFESSYDYYFGDFLKRFAVGRSWAGAHARGHLLFANYQLAKGGVQWISRVPGEPVSDQNRVFQVTDYQKAKAISRELLGMLQTYKATKNLTAIKALFEQYAPLGTEKEPWAQAIIKRGEGMKMHWAGFSQVWDVEQTAQGYELVLFGTETLEDTARHYKRMAL